MEDLPMRARMGTVSVLAALALLVPLATSAQTTPDKTPKKDYSQPAHWQFIPFVGWTVFDKKYGQYMHSDDALKPDDAIHAGARFGYVWSGGLGLELTGGWTPSKLKGNGFKGDMTWYYGSADVIYQPIISRFGGPLVAAGFGAGNMGYKNFTPRQPPFTGAGADSAKNSFNQGLFDLAVGWMIPFSDNFGLRLEARNLLWVPKDNFSSAKMSYRIYGAGLAFNFGGTPKDDDGDGVPNKKDKCPDTPKGATVDVNGCPMDTDGDGVYDGLDKCPGTPKGAKVDATGCTMDSDGDGVPDGIDQCPDTPKGVKVDLKGCPIDSDGDGVPDGIDQCPNTPTGAKVDANGCPIDSDGDGVPDGLDKCPNTPAGVKVDVDGCPIQVTERETEFLDTGLLRLEGVNFETGKAALLPEDFAKLDEVGALLAKWPQLKVEIGGHSDSRGTVAKNQTLSEARAKSVQAYLLQKFPAISADNLSAKGYGKSKPVVPNTNPENMAKNRRVEFKVLNKDVLKNVREQVKTLQK
jgi:outer membrane protein OmpA-like peptidoglycan-associated protein